MPNSLVVLTLPGPWSSRTEFLAALNVLAPHFAFAKGVLTDLQTQESVQMEFRKGRSRNTIHDFWFAGLHWHDTPEMDTLRRHTSRVILKGAGGSLDRMKHLMRVASAGVRCGATGVHVGPVGIAHPPQKWLEFEDDGLGGSLRAFVITIDAAIHGAYSCGMHNFGLKEVNVAPGVPHASTVVGIVTRHLLVKGARVVCGQTIAIGDNANRYRFCHLRTATAPDGSTIPHQVGTWQLVRADERLH